MKIIDTPFTKSVDDLYKEINSSKHGLDEQIIIKNREIYGSNKLFEKKSKKWYVIFMEQYKDILMLVLLGASFLSLLVSIIPQDNKGVGEMLTAFEGWENFVLIIIVTMINAILGTVQTLKSQKSLEGLKKLTNPKTNVIRVGKTITIDTTELVVGDILVLEAGDLISADGRIIESASLKINESSLTGESNPILKENSILKNANIPLGDRINFVYSGCLVLYGRAKVLVTGVGETSEIGKINTLLNQTKEKKTPLQVNLDKLAKFLMYSVLIICVLLFCINIIKIGLPNYDQVNKNWVSIFGDSLNFAVALAVAVIPEALSSIVTIVLSLSTKKLAKQNAIVKELKSVEGLGSVSIICSDKTGTLTQNKMSVEGIFTNGKLFSTKEEFVYSVNKMNLPEYAVLSSDAKSSQGVSIGDPTEICLIDYYNADSELLRSKYPRISELPFDSERMMMSTLINCNKEKIMITKGAIDKVLNKITHIEINGKINKITKSDIDHINKINTSFAKEGKRVLCFSYKKFESNKFDFKDEKDLIFIGLMSMIDPPRPQTIEAIKECKIAGIKTIMITGDHEETAVAIAKQIGIFNPDTDLSLSGVKLSEMSEQELALNVNKYTVYARVSPEDKIKIVRAWQSQNMIVSMTGDGVNDAPALKEANIGVAMGITGTEVSKDAASMILTDDNFATIITAIKSGRNVYNNIKNAIKYLLVGNLATIIVAAILMIFGLVLKIEFVPFAAIQLLFLNLLTDSWPAISLGLESYKENVIYEKPRKANEFFITKHFSKKLISQAILMSIIVIASFFITFYTSSDTSFTLVNNLNINDLCYDQACTIAFLTLAFCRLFHAFNCRIETNILFNKEIITNKYIIGSLVLGLALLAFIYYVPEVDQLFMHTSTKFNSSAITPSYEYYGIWIAFAYGSSILFIYQTYKLIMDKCVSKINNNNINI